MSGKIGSPMTPNFVLNTNANGDLVFTNPSGVEQIIAAADQNVGAAGTGVTAVEYGDAYQHISVLTLTAVALTPNVPADTEGVGAVIYTFPTGVYMARGAHMDITSGVFTGNSNAAELGLGSLIASGDIATLTNAAMEDWVLGTPTVANVSTFVKELSTVPSAGPPLLFEAGGSHVLNINVAGIFTSTTEPATVTGTVTIAWDFLGA